jgi:hypothetical protein
MNIQPTVLYQDAIHRTVEKTVIDHIVDVTIDIVVMPTRGDLAEVAVAVTRPRIAHHQAAL